MLLPGMEHGYGSVIEVFAVAFVAMTREWFGNAGSCEAGIVVVNEEVVATVVTVVVVVVVVAVVVGELDPPPGTGVIAKVATSVFDV